MKSKIRDFFECFADGFLMSVADSVPGVSGGTVAFVLGFYERFIKALDGFFRGDLERKKSEFKYLLKLGIGWVIGLLLSVSFLASLFESHIYEMSSLFIGFIIFAIPIVIKEELSCIKSNFFNAFWGFIGVGLVVLITYLNCYSGIAFHLDVNNIGTYIYVFFVAALAISAMVLPGVSGSTILLIFGVYIPIVTRIKDLIHLNYYGIPILITFGFGMIFGIVFFTRLIRKCLEKRRSATIYCIIGMMVGSLYSVVMGPMTLDNPQSPVAILTFKWWYFILGGIIILSIEGIKRLKSK